MIEPIGQIIARQATVRQDNLPNEDAQSLVFDDTNLFEVTKFSGYDRIETGTRANVGLQYTFQSNGGGYARVLAGESFQLAGDNAYTNPGIDEYGNPTFTPFSGLQNSRSDYVLGAYVAPWSFLQLISQSRFDQDTLDIRRQDAGGQVNIGPFSMNAVYAYLNTDPTNGILTAQEDVYGSLNVAPDRPLECRHGDALRHRRRPDRLGHVPGALRRRVLRAHRDVHRQLLLQPGYRRRSDAHAALRAEASRRVRLFDRRAQRHGISEQQSGG